MQWVLPWRLAARALLYDAQSVVGGIAPLVGEAVLPLDPVNVGGPLLGCLCERRASRPRSPAPSSKRSWLAFDQFDQREGGCLAPGSTSTAEMRLARMYPETDQLLIG
jgi:hypothetical protein